MKNIKTIEKTIEQKTAKLAKRQTTLERMTKAYEKGLAQCVKAGYAFKGDGCDGRDCPASVWKTVYKTETALESCENAKKDIAKITKDIEGLKVELEEAKREVAELPEVLKTFQVKLGAKLFESFAENREATKAYIAELKESGEWGKLSWGKRQSLEVDAAKGDDELKRDAESSARSLVFNLFYRVRETCGEVNDYGRLEITAGSRGKAVINGFLSGTRGKCEVRSVEAGGYNIVCWHIRVLVLPIKEG